MPIKNIKTLLTQATQYPAAIEAKLPEGAPKISTMMRDAANQIPVVPDFPMEVPDLPAPPEIPAIPGAPGALGKKYVTKVNVTPVTQTEIIPSPAIGVIPEVITRRGM